MRQTVLFAIAPLFALATAGCSHNVASGCTDNAGCKSGQVCVSGSCKSLCRVDADCTDHSTICEHDTCQPGQRSTPVVLDIDGDGVADTDTTHTSHRYGQQLTIIGENLAGSSVSLSDGTSTWPLAICSNDNASIVAMLPAGLASNLTTSTNYTLSVANQGGACSTTLPVLQGEPGPSGPSGPTGASGPAGPVGPSGPPVSTTDIQTAVAAMTNPDLAGSVSRTSRIRTGMLFSSAGSPAGWSTIPGLSVTLTLPRDARVTLSAWGNQRTADNASTTFCHVGYRFLVDGSPTGDATWGDTIQSSRGDVDWHQQWMDEIDLTSAAGSHTYAAQADIEGGGAGCRVCSEADGTLADYDSCRLFVTAILQ